MSLRDAFLGTTYGTESERFTLGDVPGEAPGWASGRTWAVVTAWNPRGRRISEEENRRREAELRQDVLAAGLPFLEGVNGEGEWAEGALIILGPSLRFTLQLGAKYGQAAVLWGVGHRVALVWCAPLRIERRWTTMLP